MLKLGFIGTGTLTRAVVEGLLDVHGEQIEVFLSPRSEAISRELARSHANVARLESNQAVADAARTVFLGVRPQDMQQVLGALRFRREHKLVSFVAGADIRHIAALAEPCDDVVRVTPLPPIAIRRGPIVVFPNDASIIDLFRDLGTVIVAERAEHVAALGYGGGLMSSFFAMALAALRWLENEGVPRDMARDYLMSMYSALGDVGERTPGEELDRLPAEYETPGGINERCRAYLAERRWAEVYATGIDAMKEHLQQVAAKRG
jgi:pyrroline-5-carboxylate reductase